MQNIKLIKRSHKGVVSFPIIQEINSYSDEQTEEDSDYIKKNLLNIYPHASESLDYIEICNMKSFKCIII